MRALLVLGECGLGQMPQPPPPWGCGSRCPPAAAGLRALRRPHRGRRRGEGGGGSAAAAPGGGGGGAAASWAEPLVFRAPRVPMSPAVMGLGVPGRACGAPSLRPRRAAVPVPPPRGAPLRCGSRPGSPSPACAGSPCPPARLGERRAEMNSDANAAGIYRLGDGEPARRSGEGAPAAPLAGLCPVSQPLRAPW